jgi:hypothetical protein
MILSPLPLSFQPTAQTLTTHIRTVNKVQNKGDVSGLNSINYNELHDIPFEIHLVVDLRPMRLRTGRTYDHKKIVNKLIH